MVPLPLVMVLASQFSNMSQLGNAATAALRYTSHVVKSHAISLKVLTSCGNYLSNFNVRTEQVDFAPATCGSATWMTSSSALLSGRVNTGRIGPDTRRR